MFLLKTYRTNKEERETSPQLRHISWKHHEDAKRKNIKSQTFFCLTIIVCCEKN